SGTAPTSFIFKNVMENGLRYLNIEPDKEEIIESIDSYKFPKVEGKSTKEGEQELKDKKVDVKFIGDGKKVVWTSVKEGTEVIPSQKVIVLTDKPTMPNQNGLSEIEVLTFGKLTGIKEETKVNGNVRTQYIENGSKIIKNINLVINLSEKVKSKKKE